MKPSVLAIGAHPDDIEIGCGGTLLLLKQRGYTIDLAVVTSGEEGSLSDKKATRKRREREAASAAKALGARKIIFLREPDGLTSYKPSTKTRLINIIRNQQPTMVFTHSKFDHFPDHQVVSRLSLAAIGAAAGPWYPEAGGKPYQVQACYGFEVWNPIPQPQMITDISEVMEQKIELLRHHKSQMESVNYIYGVRGLAQYRGAMSMSGEFAEAFEVIKTELNYEHRLVTP